MWYLPPPDEVPPLNTAMISDRDPLAPLPGEKSAVDRISWVGRLCAERKRLRDHENASS
jgi:hypothetical protein